MGNEKKSLLHIPFPTIRRYPTYLRLLEECLERKEEWVSATHLAEALDLKPIQVRKDVALTGIVGTPKKGFPLRDLIQALRETLGWNNRRDAVLIGVGNLGKALLGYEGFSDYGLNIIAGFDINPEKTGREIAGKTIYSLDKMETLISRMKISIAVLTVPGAFAQETTDRLVAYGIRGIWNFSPVKIVVPPSIIVQRVDLASSLALLSSRLFREP